MKNAIDALHKLLYCEPPSAYGGPEDSVGYCVFCGGEFGHEGTCDWVEASKAWKEIEPLLRRMESAEPNKSTQQEPKDGQDARTQAES